MGNSNSIMPFRGHPGQSFDPGFYIRCSTTGAPGRRNSIFDESEGQFGLEHGVFWQPPDFSVLSCGFRAKL